MRTRLPALALALGLFVASPALAQSIDGVVVEQGGGTPVVGAFVVLLDSVGEQRDVALTDADGRFRLSAPDPGEYALAVDRIGYLSAKTDLVFLAAGQEIRYRLAAVVEPVRLADIEVPVEPECRVNPADGELARVWDEARKALNVTAYTQRAGLLQYAVEGRERVLDPFTLRVREERERTRRGLSRGSPYVALDPRILSKRGFVRLEGQRQIYYGPDAMTLLSDVFLDGHCFRLVEPPADEEDLVGLRFEPDGSSRLPDIAGTLWLDASTAELRRLEFVYVNLPRPLDDETATGRVQFERLPTGEWIVRRWRIRMPVVRLPREDMYAHLTMNPDERIATVVRLKEDSGEVIEVRSVRGTGLARTPRRIPAGPIPVPERILAPPPPPPSSDRSAEQGGPFEGGSSIAIRRGAPDAGGTVVGSVRDAATGEPIPGAQVSLRELRTGATSDQRGRFRLDGLPKGRYEIQVEFLGYEVAREDLPVTTSTSTRVVARLAPTAIPSEKVEVEVLGEETIAERARGHARHRLTADDIPPSNSYSVPRLIARRFAGIKVGRSGNTGCPVVETRDGVITEVTIDGQPFRDTCILDHVIATDIRTLEVIPGLAGGLGFGRSTGGAIVITTKRGGG